MVIQAVGRRAEESPPGTVGPEIESLSSQSPCPSAEAKLGTLWGESFRV